MAAKMCIRDRPVVQITPALTSILYTDYENPLNILTAGIPFNEVTFRMTNGKILKRGNHCIAVPDEKAQTATVTATQIKNGVATVSYTHLDTSYKNNMYDIFFNKYFPLYRKKHTFAKKFLPHNSKACSS